jgi:hypothetical protein
MSKCKRITSYRPAIARIAAVAILGTNNYFENCHTEPPDGGALPQCVTCFLGDMSDESKDRWDCTAHLLGRRVGQTEDAHGEE